MQARFLAAVPAALLAALCSNAAFAQVDVSNAWAKAAFEHSAASRAAGTAARNLACIWTISTEIQRTAQKKH